MRCMIHRPSLAPIGVGRRPGGEAARDRKANGVPILQSQYDDIVGIAQRIGAEVFI